MLHGFFGLLEFQLSWRGRLLDGARTLHRDGALARRLLPTSDLQASHLHTQLHQCSYISICQPQVIQQRSHADRRFLRRFRQPLLADFPPPLRRVAMPRPSGTWRVSLHYSPASVLLPAQLQAQPCHTTLRIPCSAPTFAAHVPNASLYLRPLPLAYPVFLLASLAQPITAAMLFNTHSILLLTRKLQGCNVAFPVYVRAWTVQVHAHVWTT